MVNTGAPLGEEPSMATLQLPELALSYEIEGEERA